MPKAPYSEAKIRDEATRLVRGTVDGKPAWSDGCMLEIGTDNPFKKLKNVHWSEAKVDAVFQSIVDGLKGRIEHTATEEKFMLSPQRLSEITLRPLKQRPLAELMAGDIRQVIDKKYFDFFKSRYPDCQFHVTEINYAPVTVYNNSELVGLVMPYTARRED